MAPIQILRAFLQQASEQGSRSTVLKPLNWLLGLLIAATIIALYYRLPEWIGVLLAVSVMVVLGLFLFAYVYCLFKDRDALRSETYSIQKLAIEKGFVGDNIQGVVELREPGVVRQLAESSESSSEDKG